MGCFLSSFHQGLGPKISNPRPPPDAVEALPASAAYRWSWRDMPSSRNTSQSSEASAPEGGPPRGWVGRVSIVKDSTKRTYQSRGKAKSRTAGWGKARSDKSSFRVQ